MTFAQLSVGQPFRIGKATYTKISWGTASRDRDKAYVGIAQSAEVEPTKPESFSEQLEATGDSIERSFAEQLQDSGDKLSPEQPK